MTHFTKNIRPFVDAELSLASKARINQDYSMEFKHLENAHVIGQESTSLHVKVHFEMLKWGFRQSKMREIIGQIMRVIGAATKTAIGLVPKGNTGGSNVSPFKVMPINERLDEIIANAKSN